MVDNSWFSDLVSNIGDNIQLGWDSIKNGLSYASDAILGTNFVGDKTNKQISSQNIAFQKQENEITRQREDNAIQRAASDMTAAGLSKTLAAGQPASAASLTAPSNSYRYSAAIDKINAYERLKSLYYQDRSDKRAEALNDADIATRKAEAREAEADATLKQAQAAGQSLSNDTYMTRYGNEQLLINAQAESIRQGTLLTKAQTKLAKIEGEYKAQSIEASIKKDIEQAFLFGEQSRTQTTSRLKMISDMNVNDQNIAYYKSLINKTAQDIAESKAREYKLGYEAELVVKDLAKVDIEIASSNYNFEFSKNKSIRTTDQMSKLWGINIDNIWNKGAKALKGAWHDLWHPIWEWSIFDSDH